jgi:hypothetical protein
MLTLVLHKWFKMGILGINTTGLGENTRYVTRIVPYDLKVPFEFG